MLANYHKNGSEDDYRREIVLRNKLTGRRRHRIESRWFKSPLLVLQIEVKGFVPEYTPRSIEGEIRTWWVDAPPEHLMLEAEANE